jgi:hypothetical protein
MYVKQGDLIGGMFAHWVIVFVGQFLEITERNLSRFLGNFFAIIQGYMCIF